MRSATMALQDRLRPSTISALMVVFDSSRHYEEVDQVHSMLDKLRAKLAQEMESENGSSSEKDRKASEEEYEKAESERKRTCENAQALKEEQSHFSKNDKRQLADLHERGEFLRTAKKYAEEIMAEYIKAMSKFDSELHSMNQFRKYFSGQYETQILTSSCFDS
jgi:uncharacterized protein (DUF3084 family)